MQRAFTLLEVLIAIVLLAIASSVVGLRMHKAIEKKKFQTELQQLRSRIKVSQKLAISMQADWRGTLKKEEKGWVFEAKCEEVEGRRLPPLHLDRLEIFFNGKRVEELNFDFFASGHTFPEGVFLFQSDAGKERWKTSELFLREEGGELGPLHPNDG